MKGQQADVQQVHHTQEATMKASMTKWCATLVAGLLAVLAAPASAQLSTTANGPYYATPSWDQKLTTNRFVILLNWNSEAVLDRETGLVWWRNADRSAGSLAEAFQTCRNSRIGGRAGWRLPFADELASLIEVNPAPNALPLPPGHPFTGVSRLDVFWTQTTNLDPNSPFALVQMESPGFAVNTASPNSNLGAWCVRGSR